MFNVELSIHHSPFNIQHFCFRRLCRTALGIEGLGVPAFATPVMNRVAACPRVESVTDGALGFLGWERPLAMIAGERLALGVHVVFTTDFVANRTSPTDHLFPPPRSATIN